MGEGWRRVVVERVQPSVDGGRFPIKRTVGERVVVEADVFADGHDQVGCRLLFRPAGEAEWRAVPMRALGNDRWRAELTVSTLGLWLYTVEGWVNHFGSWRRDLRRRLEAAQEVGVELQIGAHLLLAAAARAPGDEAARLRRAARGFRGPGAAERALDEGLAELMGRNPDLELATRHQPELVVSVDRERARFGAWYETFPRSSSPAPGRPGTFRDLEARLPDIAEMGFDVLYLPPIHPIGRSHRKGREGRLGAAPGEPGSPWAIGGPEGGHKAIHPELGSREDFRRLLAAAGRHGIEVALDIAFQTSPDHPYVSEHPEWYRRRPDGTVQYAENPPKRYQDIYPFDFEAAAWRELSDELRGVFDFWIAEGVRIFRVDNPHTKPFAFWEWLIGGLKACHPDLILLSEAFTRPKVMYRLAKLGFTQSYTYFAWRNQARELREYFHELTRTEVCEYFRASLWPNTPDILTEALQAGGRPASALRFLLAATVGASYGIYGPAFELAETRPLAPGREEYAGSEKYEVRHWDLGTEADTLRPLIRRVNRVRREHPALQHDRTLRFLRTDNEMLLAYAKTAPDGSDPIVVIVNLDWRYRQSGWVEVPVAARPGGSGYAISDQLDGATYRWRADGWNYVELHPGRAPGHLFSLEAGLRLAPEATDPA